MSLTNSQKNHIQEVVIDSLRRKFQKYTPESNNMPFHYRLLGKDRMALYSFIQSLNTTFGTSIFEPVAVALAKSNFKKAEAQYIAGDSIYENCQREINNIINELSMGKTTNKPSEMNRLKKSLSGAVTKLKTVKIDLFLEDKKGFTYLFDLKTAKPNISNFKDFKRTLLEWAGIILTQDKNANVNSLIAIPYNPYEPKPYERWTMKGMLDLDNELKVADEFWDFLGGKGAYIELLDCFEKAGIILRPEIDNYFSKFNKQ